MRQSVRAVLIGLLAIILVVPSAGSSFGSSDHDARPSADVRTDESRVELVVRFKNKQVYGPQQLVRDYPVVLTERLLASRGIFLFRPSDANVASDAKKTRHLAEEIAESPHVRYAEGDSAVALSDHRYHSWPKGKPRDLGRQRSRFRQQPLVSKLRLARVRRVSQGAGVVVAVLDTGVARRHRELRSRLWSGYDYVADDGDPSEVRSGLDTNANGHVDEAYGHGTFVSGIVALIAPRARILPMRVLDSDGSGSVFLVARAIVEAVNRGADVINISLGTPDEVESRLLDQALDYAHDHDVHVVAAAGNANTDDEQYPATQKRVLSVSSTQLDRPEISDFANWGKWVDLAAPADRLRGPIPGGRYARWAGTSMAAPQVSAQLALVMALGEQDFDRQRDAIEKTALDVHGKKVKHGAVDILTSLGHVRRRTS